MGLHSCKCKFLLTINLRITLATYVINGNSLVKRGSGDWYNQPAISPH